MWCKLTFFQMIHLKSRNTFFWEQGKSSRLVLLAHRCHWDSQSLLIIEIYLLVGLKHNVRRFTYKRTSLDNPSTNQFPTVFLKVVILPIVHDYGHLYVGSQLGFWFVTAVTGQGTPRVPRKTIHCPTPQAGVFCFFFFFPELPSIS